MAHKQETPTQQSSGDLKAKSKFSVLYQLNTDHCLICPNCRRVSSIVWMTILRSSTATDGIHQASTS